MHSKEERFVVEGQLEFPFLTGCLGYNRRIPVSPCAAAGDRLLTGTQEKTYWKQLKMLAERGWNSVDINHLIGRRIKLPILPEHVNCTRYYRYHYHQLRIPL